ncbi:serine/threonine protein kinase [Labilithrix luteola]|uniref:Serine/threonine protein kinase n=1 Tax=Labilithrix luteola TaxID=1391654 RepID=A0A0K1QFV4_9BACT|nr:protein kinase [Labilithrix luteola]AKV04656.1 serine/threonine protein kinase [Labilithrix luteola]
MIVGTDGVARVLDFGIAKAAGRIQVTREGQIKGKLAYMAPEQIRGNVDRRTDLFAAGVVLWEMLANRRLHDGLKDIDIVSRVVNGQLSAPSAYAQDLPAVLDAIVLRSLATDPANRFTNAREFAIEIERNVKLASSSEVSEWVERLAHDTISVRTERVAAMERASQEIVSVATQAPDRIPTVDHHMDVEVGHYDVSMPGTTSSGVFAHTQTSPNSVSRPAPSSGGRGLGIALFGLFVLLGVIGAVLGVSAIRQRNNLASQAAPPSAAPVPKAAGVASIASAVASAPQAPSSASTIGADAGTSDVRPAPSVAPSPKPGAPARPNGIVPAPKPTAEAVANKKPGVSCDPPFTVDEAGHRHYKPECLE